MDFTCIADMCSFATRASITATPYSMNMASAGAAAAEKQQKEPPP